MLSGRLLTRWVPGASVGTLLLGRVSPGLLTTFLPHRKSLCQRRSEWTPQWAGQVRGERTGRRGGAGARDQGISALCVLQVASLGRRTRWTRSRCTAARPSQAHNWPLTPLR